MNKTCNPGFSLSFLQYFATRRSPSLMASLTDAMRRFEIEELPLISPSHITDIAPAIFNLAYIRRRKKYVQKNVQIKIKCVG